MSPRSLRLPGHETEIDIEGVSLLTGLGDSLIEEIGGQVRSGAITRASYDFGSSTLTVVTEPSDESVIALVGAQFWDSPFGDDGDTALRALLNAASRTVATLSAEHDCLEGDYNIARRAHEAVIDEIASTRVRIDPHAATHLRRVRRAIDGATRRSDHDDKDVDGSPIPAETDRPEVTGTAVESVRDALAAMEAAPRAASPASGPSPQELADELDKLTAQVTEIERRLDSEGESLEERMSALDQARQRVTGLKQARRPDTVSAEDIAELESAHERVLEAEGRVSGRFRAGKAMKHLEEATEHEQAILDRLGFATWSAFIMGTTLFGSDEVVPGELGEARTAAESIRTAVDALTKNLDADDEYRTLQHRRSALLKAGAELVGIRPDVVDALRALEGSPSSSGESADDHADDEDHKAALVEALMDAEVIDDDTTLDSDELMKIASDWLDEIDTEEPKDSDDEHPEPAPSNIGELIDDGAEEDSRGPARRRALDDATARLAQHRSALEQTAALLEQVEVLREEEIAAQARLEQHRGRLEGARRGRAQLAAQLVGWRLRTGEAGADPYSALTETGEAGLVVVEPLDGCEIEVEIVLEALGVFAEQRSLTVMSDDPRVVAWAEDQEFHVVEVDRALATS